MSTHSEVQLKVQKLERDLLELRGDKARSSKRVPLSIRRELVELYKLGWSVTQIKEAFHFSPSTLYDWIKNSTNTRRTKDLSGKSLGDRSSSKTRSKIQKPKHLKLVEEAKPVIKEHSPLDGTIQLEFRSGIKLNMPQKQMSFEFLKILNSI